MANNKRGFIQKVKDYWNSLSGYDKTWIAAVGVWTVDGFLIGSAITAAKKNKEIKKLSEAAYFMGAQDGKIAAYRDMASNPYQMMDIGMRKLEQQGKAKHF